MEDLPNTGTVNDVAYQTSLLPDATNLVIKHCMVVGVALHFTVVTSWATQSVVERPVSAPSCTRCIVVCIIAMVVHHIVASAISVVLVDIVVEIAMANWLVLALILLCCSGDGIRKPWIVIVTAFCDIIGDSSCASFW